MDNPPSNRHNHWQTIVVSIAVGLATVVGTTVAAVSVVRAVTHAADVCNLANGNDSA
jgi:hypothetical protein